MIEYSDRLFLTGMTRSGKSTLARRLFESAPAPRLVIDPADSTLTATPGAVTFSDPDRFPLEAETARFIPDDPDDIDAYHRVYATAFNHFPRWVWLDEAGIAMPAQGYPKAGNRYIVQGAKRQLGHLACHTRPREVARNLIAQASHVVVFALPDPADVKHVADVAGIPAQELAGIIRGLPDHGYVWFDRRAQTLLVCPPLR